MLLEIAGRVPRLGAGAFVHPAACVIGRVSLGARASVWPCAVLRGDTDEIVVGDETNVQDGAVVHADEGVPCHIGHRVTIGHRACVHGCVIEDEVLIGIGAVVLNGARVGAGSVLGAGAVVTEGTVVPPGSLVLGLPGRVRGPVSPEQRAMIVHGAAHYVQMIDLHR